MTPVNCFLQVIKLGQLTLIQDYGRYGFSPAGVTQSGPLDDYAYSWANHLLGNEANCAALEITLGQAEFVSPVDCMIAIAGADLAATIDEKALENWASHRLLKGQRLKFALARNGLRAYLAIRGGFQTGLQLGSASTTQRESLGGLHRDGSPLVAGDRLVFLPHILDKKSVRMTFRYKPDYNLPIRLRVIEGYQAGQFPESSLSSLYRQVFTVTQHINRMGYRLQGEPLPGPSQAMLSEGIALGAIQIPPDGQPIVLLNERQTIGGYPKIGCVARLDLPRLAQARPGQKVQFIRGELEELQLKWCQWARFFGY